MSSHNHVEIRRVDFGNKRQIKKFIKFHYLIYKNDPNWVAPLIVDYIDKFNLKKNPYFLHSQAQLFLAYRDGSIVGRICAHENTNHVKYQKEPVGFFGFFECINDQTVADALFGSASAWLQDKNLETMRGPASFSVNGDPVGLLVECFDMPPVVGMAYNPPYYQQLLEKSGFEKAQDLLAYRFAVSKPEPSIITKIAERVLKDPKLIIRNPNMKQLRKEVEKLKFLYNEALANNWGAVPMTEEEFEHFSDELKLAVDPDLTFIAEYDGKPIGLSMVFVDMNRAMQSAKGRLLPFGLLKILLNKKKVDWARLPILGVVEEYRARGIDAVFYVKSMEGGYKKNYRHGELSWVLESNAMMNRILKHLDLKVYRTYRMYDRDIS
ncbi:MAG: N-acetyltransferase [Spirochaetales bacterium]|nr:N-acetyltransferase [Spirochaetales bacterium]